VAWDQHLIAEPEGPSFISRTVTHRRLDRRLLVSHDPELTSAVQLFCAAKSLFNHLVGECEHVGRNLEAQGFSGSEVYNELKLG